MIWNNTLILSRKKNLLSFVFNTDSKRFVDVGLVVLRLGISFGFIWASIGKISNPAGFGQMLQSMAGMDPILSVNMALIIGIAELLSGCFVLIGFITRPAASFQIIILISAIVMFGFDFTKGPSIWKDPSMLGLAIVLMLSGSGKFGIDHLITRKLNKPIKKQI